MRATTKRNNKHKRSLASGMQQKETTKAETVPLHGEVGHLLRRANQFAMAKARKKLDAYKVTPTQYAVLRGLDELGPTIQRRLALHVGLEPSNVHGLLKRMQSTKLIKISVDPVSQRTNIISLTKKGLNLLSELSPLFLQHDKDLRGMLSNEERDHFLSALKKLAGIR